VVKIVQDAVPPIPDRYSDDLKALVKLLLQKNPADRPSLKKLFALPFVRTRLESLARQRALPFLDDVAPPPRHRRESSLMAQPTHALDVEAADARPGSRMHRRELSASSRLVPPELHRTVSQDLPPTGGLDASDGSGGAMRRSASTLAFGAMEGADKGRLQTRLDVLATPKKTTGGKHSRSRSSIQFDHVVPPILLDDFASSPSAAAEMYLRHAPSGESADPLSASGRARGHSRTDSSLNDSAGRKTGSRRSSAEAS